MDTEKVGIDVTAQLLKNKYNLHKTPEVEQAALRTKQHTDEKVPQDPLAQISNYLERLNNIANPSQDESNPNFKRQERNLGFLKQRLYDRFVIKLDEIPESYWENHRRIIRERGQGGDLAQLDFEELKRQNTEAVIAEQRASLNMWVDYLASPDAPYSPGIKYYVLRNLLTMSEGVKNEDGSITFGKRSKGTTKPFPDLNREALAYVIDAVTKKYKGYDMDLSGLEQQDKEQLEKLLDSENFPKLYAWAIERVTPASAEQLKNSDGQWIKFNQGSDPRPLVESLQGMGTGWCTAGETTAQTQLQGGDFYVYYSYDEHGKPTVPRVAIRMEGKRIAEVRGIAKDQNIDSGVAEVVDEKLKEFPDGDAYKKKVADMRRLTELEQKIQEGEELNGDELKFLYEIDSPIEGFGYTKDPRISELRGQRDNEKDMPVVFGCEVSQIAHSVDQIDSNTKAYVGRLGNDIFTKLSEHNIEYVYTSFPERRINFQTIEIGGRTKEEIEDLLKREGIKTTMYWSSMLQDSSFTTLAEPQKIMTVNLSAEDLGMRSDVSMRDMYNRVPLFGLRICPPEVGPYLSLANKNEPLQEHLYVGMYPIYKSSHVFAVGRNADGSIMLDSRYAAPGHGKWTPEGRYVFAVR